MVNVEFNLNQNIEIIEARLDSPFQYIIEQFVQKASIEPNSVYFIANSKQIEPHKTVENYMNDIDKQNNKITVFVNSVNTEECKNKEQDIIHSKDIICPKCKEPCRFTIDNYKIKLFDCAYNHITNDIKFDDFYKTQEREIPEIICDICKNSNIEISNDHEFFECLNCKKCFCFPCKENHDLSHNIIKYDQKKYLCSKHNNSFIKYCEDCCLNICYLCTNEHAYHKTISIIDINKDIEKSKNKLKDFRIILDTLTEQINEITSKLYKLIDDLNIYYEINNKEKLNKMTIVYNRKKKEYN